MHTNEATRDGQRDRDSRLRGRVFITDKLDITDTLRDCVLSMRSVELDEAVALVREATMPGTEAPLEVFALVTRQRVAGRLNKLGAFSFKFSPKFSPSLDLQSDDVVLLVRVDEEEDKLTFTRVEVELVAFVEQDDEALDASVEH